MKIVHLTKDEKFIDGAFTLFDTAFPGQNTFVVLSPFSAPPIRFIQQAPVVAKIVKGQGAVAQILPHIESADWVVLHGMNATWAKLLEANVDLNRILYIVWGAEVYSNKLIYQRELYGPKTKQLKAALAWRDRLDFSKNVKGFVKKAIYGKKVDKEEEWKKNADALKKIRRVGIVLREEFELYQELGILQDAAHYQRLAYYPIEYFTKNINLELRPGSNILIGNSSALSNNHLEVFDMLELRSANDRIIVVPLSYGPPIAAAKITAAGKAKFGQQFQALTDFLPLDEYTRLLQSCGIVIMNHYRQQAIGNVLSAVFLGAKVYLHPNNTMLHFLLRIGCKVCDITQDFDRPDALENLSSADIATNRERLTSALSAESLASSLRAGLESKS
ncbi:MAG: TDP-N-acetylfucosamine:lipid II N-acetylfucosaminyltransferase [Bacteroidota bacterium]